jgi:hypothetical protein
MMRIQTAPGVARRNPDKGLTVGAQAGMIKVAMVGAASGARLQGAHRALAAGKKTKVEPPARFPRGRLDRENSLGVTVVSITAKLLDSIPCFPGL